MEYIIAGSALITAVVMYNVKRTITPTIPQTPPVKTTSGGSKSKRR